MGAQKGSQKEQMEKKQAEMEKQQAMRAGMLAKILSPAARERINTIKLVKPQQAMQVENYFLKMAQAGRIANSVSEAQVKEVLKGITSTKAKTKITYARKVFDDS